MRLSTIVLCLAVLLPLAGCGDDEPEEATIPRPTSTLPARPDTALGDTTAAGPAAARPAGPGAAQANEAGGAAGGGEQPAGGGGGQPGAQRPGAPGRAAPAAEAPAAGQRLYTVQVAAFTSADSASKWTGRLSSLDLPAWTSMAELGGTTYYRVRVGAVPTVSEARRLGAILAQRFEWPVWVAPVTAADRVPDEAVAETRRVLGGE